jgi:sensor histidine kinase regulating citrate/malate metabolism
MYALVHLINYQLFDFLLSLELKSHILETNSHFTPELLISTLGNLTMSNLTYTARLLE